MSRIVIKVMQGLTVIAIGVMLTVFLQTSSTLADQPDFTRPYKGVEPTLGRRPLLVLLLRPDDPRMWDQVNVYALQPDRYMGQTSIRVTSSGQLDHWRQRVPMKTTQRFASAPAVMNSPDGHLQSVFALGEDGYIYQSYHSCISNTEKWQNWTQWSALPKTRQFISAPAVMNSPDGDLASVFALGEHGHIYQIVYSRKSGGGWGNWSKVPGDIRFQSAPAVMNSPDGDLASVFALGQDGHIHQIVYSRKSGGGWGEWQQLPGSYRFQSAPAVTNSPDGWLAEVFALGQDGYIYQIVYNRRPNRGWGDWISLPRTVRFQSAPAVINLPDENLTSVFALGQDSYLYHISYSRESGQGWGSWKQLPGNEQFRSAPAVISRQAHIRTPEYYDRLIFGPDQSVQGYYLENSYGNFTFDQAYITPWLTAQDNPSTPIDESSLWFFHFYDEANEYRKKSAWAIEQVERMTPFRFKDYDTNPKDGKVTSDELGILWIYPGDADARARGTDPSLVTGEHYKLSAGVEIGLLARGAAGMGWPTMAHELGHEVLHLDDLYKDSIYPGVGHFSLMSYEGAGSHLDPWSKMKLGWLYPEVVTQDGRKTLRAVESRYANAYILYDPDHGAHEYFIVENRWPDGSYEAKLPDKGLAIWHIKESHEPSYDHWGRKTIQLVWAGGVGNEEVALWDGADLRTFGPAYLKWRNGQFSGINVVDIPRAGSEVEVTFEFSDKY